MWCWQSLMARRQVGSGRCEVGFLDLPKLAPIAARVQERCTRDGQAMSQYRRGCDPAASLQLQQHDHGAAQRSNLMMSSFHHSVKHLLHMSQVWTFFPAAPLHFISSRTLAWVVNCPPPGLAVADLDFARLEAVRQRMPIEMHRCVLV